MAHPYAANAKSSHSRRLNAVAGKSGDANSPFQDTAKVAGIANASKTAGEMAIKGGAPRMRADRYARGGAVKGKKGTQVNIVIAGKPDAAEKPVPVPVPMPAGPPPAPPMMGPPGAGGPPGMPPMPPPGMRNSGGRVSFKRGGAVKRADGGAAGQFSPQGRSYPVNMPGLRGDGKPARARSESTEREQIKRSNARMGTSEPPSLLHRVINPNDAAVSDAIYRKNRTALDATGPEDGRKRGGKVKETARPMPFKRDGGGRFASGGIVREKGLGFTAGAGDGEGRLEKVAKAKKKTGLWAD